MTSTSYFHVSRKHSNKVYELIKSYPSARLMGVHEYLDEVNFILTFEDPNEDSQFWKKYYLLTTPIKEVDSSNKKSILIRKLRNWLSKLNIFK